MKLFQVSLPNHTAYFANKAEAKAYRDLFNVTNNTGYAVVSIGPDHWRYGLSASKAK